MFASVHFTSLKTSCQPCFEELALAPWIWPHTAGGSTIVLATLRWIGIVPILYLHFKRPVDTLVNFFFPPKFFFIAWFLIVNSAFRRWIRAAFKSDWTPASHCLPGDEFNILTQTDPGFGSKNLCIRLWSYWTKHLWRDIFSFSIVADLWYKLVELNKYNEKLRQL